MPGAGKAGVITTQSTRNCQCDIHWSVSMPWASCFWRWDVTYRGKVGVEELNTGG